jgi:hypothetical protein
LLPEPARIRRLAEKGRGAGILSLLTGEAGRRLIKPSELVVALLFLGTPCYHFEFIFHFYCISKPA